MTSGDDTPAAETGEPQVFMALPNRAHGSFASYEHHLGDLLGQLGIEPPAIETGNPGSRRSWELRAARLIGKAIRMRPPEETWVRPLMSAAVLEPDPSHNRWLVEPALAASRAPPEFKRR